MPIITSTVTIRASTIEEELTQIQNILPKKEYYEKNGYRPVYPDNPLLNNPEILKDPNDMLEILKTAEYDVNFYTCGINFLLPLKNKVEELISKLKELSRAWSFKIFPEYQIILTKYGPGGNYYYQNGTIVMLTTREGRFKRSDPLQTIIHEIVHIGIEENIIKKYKLSQWEKEKLVDLIVRDFFREELPDYKMQNLTVEKMDKYVNPKTLLTLPSAIEIYIDATHTT